MIHDNPSSNAFKVPPFDAVEVPGDRAASLFIRRGGFRGNHYLLHVEVVGKQDNADGARRLLQGRVRIGREAPERKYWKLYLMIP